MEDDTDIWHHAASHADEKVTKLNIEINLILSKKNMVATIQ